ncbi:MAG: ABC transporter ATP-binding protein, partial [Asgard group archaeon]|nr:ABC transporter ATP-binding protein [Asgard group archaeon]
MTPTVKFTISLLKKFMKPYIGLVFILALSIISYNALEIFLPQIVRIYINTALNDIFNYKFLLISSIIYLGVSIVYRLIMVAITHLNMRLAWLTTNDLRVDLITHCINLDMTFHNKKKTGEMIERIDGDSTALSDFFSNFSIYFVGGLLLILGVIITTFVEGWMYGLVFLGFVLIAFISIFFIRNVVSPYW